MLVQYTSLSSLNAAELQELRHFVSNMVLEGRRFITFQGKCISTAELQVQKRIWENEVRGSTRQALFG